MLLFKWFIIAFRVKKKKNWPDLSPCFSLWLRFQKFFIYHLTDCAPTTLGIFQDFECAQGFCACPPLFLRYSSPKNSHGWFHLISSWMRQLKCLFFKKAFSSLSVKAHQSLFYPISLYVFFMIPFRNYFLKFSYPFVHEHSLFPTTECQLHQSRDFV